MTKMKHAKRIAAGCVSLMLMAAAYLPSQVQAAGSYPLYRLYNPNTGEHFYTVFSNEKNSLIYNGWTYEGVGWNAPDEGWYVYRLYNPNTGDHHYTMDTDERDYLARIGWRDEGTAFASPSLGWENTATAQGKPVYRLYNPNAAVGAHYYTTSAREVNALHRLGWRYEGIGWYAL